jgi:ATP-dependent Clp endopeptidase proteolytic subunit ClpP
MKRQRSAPPHAAKIGAPLLSPQGRTPVDNVPQGNWYKINARDGGIAEIALFDEIGGWGITARQFAQELASYRDISLIKLYIHSPGGDVFEGMAIYNLLRNHPARVDGEVLGLAASMGSVIAMACDTLIMPENAMMMIHRPWGIQGGDADNMRRYADLLDKVEDTLVTAYTTKTGKSADEIKTMLAAETWLTGAEAVEQGFADQLAQPLQMAASLTSKRIEEFEHMPDKLKALMSPRGQGNNPPPPANPAPAPAPSGAAPTAPANPAPANPAPTAGYTREQFQQEEQQRRQAVAAVFAPFGTTHAALQQECLNDMSIDAAAAKDKLLQALGSGTTPTAPPRPDTHINAGNGNIVGDGLRNSLAARVQLETLESDNVYAGMSLREMARAYLVDNGVGIASYRGDVMGMVGAAFTHTTGDFGNILSDVARRQMLRGYEEAEETFQRWTARGSLPDFREMGRVDLTTFPSLRKVREGAEYKYATVGDRQEKIALATYGELLSITRQAIINDDLSAFTRIPRMMGRAAIRTVGDLVYAILGSNPKMGDGKALFHADHNNLLSAAALSIARYDEGKTKMARQKEGDAVLNIRPAYHIVPVSMESTARALLAAEFDPSMAEARVPNPVRGMAEVIADARLDEQSTTTSYLAASPTQYDTIEVAYLDGNDQPYMEQQQGFTVDGAVFKVRMDAGVAPLSYRTLLKMPGA